MDKWRKFLKYDPIPALKSIQDPVLGYFIQRDLLESDPGPIQQLWTQQIALKILKKQQPNGSWPDKSPKRHSGSPTNYLLVETYRNLGILIDKFGFDRRHSAVQNAAEFIFSTQTEEGDFRGIYGSQYSPNYCAGLLELLVKAGFTEDSPILKAFKWFLSIQQVEGGWTAPLQTQALKMRDMEEIMKRPKVYQFQPDKIFSHAVTGIIIRAFAAHPEFRRHPDALKSADLLTQRFFQKDKYSFRQDSSYWTKCSFPFWWFDLISVLDALSLMEIPVSNQGITQALNYYRKEQSETGLWNFYILKGRSMSDLSYWLNFILCRIFKRLLGK